MAKTNTIQTPSIVPLWRIQYRTPDMGEQQYQTKYAQFETRPDAEQARHLCKLPDGTDILSVSLKKGNTGAFNRLNGEPTRKQPERPIPGSTPHETVPNGTLTDRSTLADWIRADMVGFPDIYQTTTYSWEGTPKREVATKKTLTGKPTVASRRLSDSIEYRCMIGLVVVRVIQINPELRTVKR